MLKRTPAETSISSDYRDTKIGKLPASWQVLSLEDVTDQSAPIRYGVVQIGPDTPGGVPIVPIKHIRRINTATLHRASPVIEAEYVGSRVTGGDVLISVKGTIGDVGVVPDGFEGNTAREIARIRTTPKCDPYYLSFLLQADHTQRRIERLVVGSTRLEFSIHAVKDFLIPLPPLPEQRKIAEILRAWDEAIAACERLIAKLTARQIALVHQLVFGERRLGNYARSREAHKNRWLTVPTDWTVVTIGSVAEERSEVNRNGDAAEVLSCSKYDGFVRSLEYFKKQVFSSDLSGYKLIRRGDFGFPSNHVEEGSIGLQNLVDEGLVSPIYTVFRFDAERVDNDFAYSVLKTELYRHIFQVSTSASVDRRGSLRWSDFSMLPFPLPSIDEQRAIQNVLTAGQSQIDRQQLERDALAKQKRGLMQKLLTGKWRVKANA